MSNSHCLPDKTRRSCLCCVWCAGVNWTIVLNVFRLQIFCRRHSLELSGIQFTPPERTRHRQDSFVVSDVAVWISFKSKRICTSLLASRGRRLRFCQVSTPGCVWVPLFLNAASQTQHAHEKSFQSLFSVFEINFKNCTVTIKLS